MPERIQTSDFWIPSPVHPNSNKDLSIVTKSVTDWWHEMPKVAYLTHMFFRQKVPSPNLKRSSGLHVDIFTRSVLSFLSSGGT